MLSILIYVHMGSCGSASVCRDGGCHERTVLIGHTRLTPKYMLWGELVPVWACFENPFPLYRIFSSAHFGIKRSWLPIPWHRSAAVHLLGLRGQITVAAQSKAWVLGRTLAGIVVSNPTGAWMFVLCLLYKDSNVEHKWHEEGGKD
jgi:hypothetical protein